MTIRQVKTGWQVDIQPGGRAGKRVKKTFTTKAEATGWERHIQAKVQESPEWAPPKKDARLVSDLVELWYLHHGAELRDGIGRKNILLAMCLAMGNPRADKFTTDQFAEYRMQRIEAGIKPSTVNHEHAYLRAVFNETKRLGNWTKENPLTNLRPFKIQEQELSYLSNEQIPLLLNRLETSTNIHAKLITKVCLSIGARWGEVENLHVNQVRDGMIQLTKTKSSKGRAIPISATLESELHEHHKNHGNGDKLFTSSYFAFRTA